METEPQRCKDAWGVMYAESATYDFLTHRDLPALVDGFISGAMLRHDFLSKLEILKEQVIAQHNDEHRSGAV